MRRIMISLAALATACGGVGPTAPSEEASTKVVVSASAVPSDEGRAIAAFGLLLFERPAQDLGCPITWAFDRQGPYGPDGRITGFVEAALVPARHGGEWIRLALADRFAFESTFSPNAALSVCAYPLDQKLRTVLDSKLYLVAGRECAGPGPCSMVRESTSSEQRWVATPGDDLEDCFIEKGEYDAERCGPLGLTLPSSSDYQPDGPAPELDGIGNGGIAPLPVPIPPVEEV